MDVTSSRLIVAFYLGLGVLVAWVGFLSLRRLDSNPASLTTALEVASATSGKGSAKRPYPVMPPPLPVAANASIELETIKQLRAMLDRRTAMYRQTNERLAKVDAEYARVREEADKYLGLLAELLTREAESAEGISSGERTTTKSLSSEPEEPGEPHKTEPHKTEPQKTEPQRTAKRTEPETDPVSAEDQALARIAELEALLDAASVVTNETTRVLVKVGAPAVPELIEQLANEDPLQRRWAATVLGRMGAQAKDAEGALVMALDDSDAEVRRAAEVAIQQID